ncbi:HU family DNA-binding protein [Desulfovibrio sp. TomC]|uniref:HU family DNA-binding protein n=1 Tax=Desulfovibrio sp. TomC TaxID=1562888 RepID=UPI000574F64B|nr:HU family DNA-binding protein [Desulfovibrio sp. TomC]KHK01319.1 Integration host factor beta subunit [Desulfovibrio sp. TomC]
MNKSELIKVFGERFNTPDNEAADFVNVFFEKIRQALIEGDRVEIRGFGSFAMKDYEGYTGRNPKSGEAVTVEPKRLPFFKAGRRLKALLNE